MLHDCIAEIKSLLRLLILRLRLAGRVNSPPLPPSSRISQVVSVQGGELDPVT